MERVLSYYNYNPNNIDSRNAKRVKFGDNNLHNIGLHLKILSTEDIDNPTLHPSVVNRYYFTLVWVNPGDEYFTLPAEGLLDPVWNTERVILLKNFPNNYAFLNLEVLRLMSVNDPGTSTGMVTVGRARIPLPKELYCEKTGRFGLVRAEGEGYKAEGHIKLSMELRKYNFTQGIGSF